MKPLAIVPWLVASVFLTFIFVCNWIIGGNTDVLLVGVVICCSMTISIGLGSENVK